MEQISIEPIKPTKIENIQNKNKSITVIYGKDDKYSINFINQGTKLTIEAKTYSDILSKNYSNQFSLKDIKQVKFFNDDYESIDDCLSEIFDKLDKNETQIEKTSDEAIIVKVPLYTKRYPFIDFSLKKIEKDEKQKFSDLLNIVVDIKKKQESEIKFLQDKINFLETLLVIKKNEDYKKGLESFKGSVIEMTCFGRNDIRKYLDLEQDYTKWKEGDKNNKDPFFVSFVFKCKDEKDIPLVVESFKAMKKVYAYPDDVYTRIENNKIFIEWRTDDDLFEDENIDLSNLCFGSGQSLIIKTDAIPKDIFGEITNEKMLKFCLNTELEFKNITPQVLLFAKNFEKGMAKYLPLYLQDIVRDIFQNLVEGNYKYKVQKSLIEKEVAEFPEFFKEVFVETMDIFKLEEFKDYKKINFEEIELNLISSQYKAGFNFSFKLPLFNELIDDFLTGKIK